MNSRLKELTKLVPAKHLIFIMPLWFVIFDFLLSASFTNNLLRFIFGNYFLSSFLLFLIFCLLIFIFISPGLIQKKHNLAYSLIILLPIILLSFWSVQKTNITILMPFLVVFATQIVFYKILFYRKNLNMESDPRKEKIALLIIIILYFFIFSYISICIFDALDFFNPKDFGLFNQIFWNTIHGKLFLNSTYGSHFACHNSLFFLLLVPFYYLFPHPLTLLVLKIMLLSLSAIPFYLITKDILKQTSALPLVVTFLLFPYIVGQNFTPPHEMGYAPFFILFTFYFFQKKKIIPFFIFLLITVSIKETLAFLAVMFGCYAFLKKRGIVWIAYPILIGITWFIASMGIINYFQELYQPHSDSAWYFVYLKKIFLIENNGGPLTPIAQLLLNSNIAHWHILKPILLFFFSLGLLPALLGSATILGLPELMINLLACNSNMFSPIWHYNTTLSCFILIGTIQGIKKISYFASNKKYLQLTEHKLQLLLSIFILSCTIVQSYTWLEHGKCKRDTAYIKEVKEALSFVPLNASISVPVRIAIIVSSREKYSIAGTDSGEDYVLIDSLDTEKKLKTNIDFNYNEIYRKESIILYKIKK